MLRLARCLTVATILALTVHGNTVSAVGPIQVNSTTMALNGSDGVCSLPEAIIAANSDMASGAVPGECAAGVYGHDTISLPPGVYTVALPDNNHAGSDNGLPIVRSPIEIEGAGAEQTIIERSSAAGTPDFRLFYVQSTGTGQDETTGSLALKRVTVRGGSSDFGAAIRFESTSQLSNAVVDSVLESNTAMRGGAVYAVASLFTIRNSIVRNNSASDTGSDASGGVFVSGRVVVEHSTWSGNTSNGNGGALGVGHNGVMDITDSVFRDNYAQMVGGGLYGFTTNVARSWFHRNRADRDGGGIYALTLAMSHTTMSDNIALLEGGGIAVVPTFNASGVIEDSTFVGNVAGNNGGAIAGPALTITNTTVSGNRAAQAGGGISATSAFTGNNLTVTNNVVTKQFGAGGGLWFHNPASRLLSNSIVAGNTSGFAGLSPDCGANFFSPIASGGHNLIGNACGCSLVAAAGDQLGAWDAPIDPRLGPLQGNGGPTATHGLLAGSPALDSGSPLEPGSTPAACAVTDQRGIGRPVDGDADGDARSDRGAVEHTPSLFPSRPSFSAATYHADEPGGSATITIDRVDGTGEANVDYRAVAGSAADGADFLAAAGTLVFLDGETTKTFWIQLLDDADVEGTESVNLELRPANGSLDAPPSARAALMIHDDDSFPIARGDETAVAEGDTGTVTAAVTVRLNRAYSFDVQVQYSLIDADATAPADYEAQAGTLIIPAGQTTGIVIVTVNGDSVDEIDERFRLRVTTWVGCVSETRVSDVIIVDDDLPANRAPSIAAPDPQTNNEGDVVSLAITAADPDDDELTFSAAGLPPGLSIDSLTGEIHGPLSSAGAGGYSVTVTVSDGVLHASVAFAWTVLAPAPPPPPTNRSPVCSAAAPTLPMIWPPNHKRRYEIGILGVTDPDDDPVDIRVTGIRQDEPTNTLGDGTTWIDGGGVGTGRAWVRGERMGGADGRVYHIAFTAADSQGASCTGVVRVGVPHDMGSPEAIDGGPLYDSTVAVPRSR